MIQSGIILVYALSVFRKSLESTFLFNSYSIAFQRGNAVAFQGNVQHRVNALHSQYTLYAYNGSVKKT